MNNVHIEKITQVNITLTADQWDLYTRSRDCSEAAEALNKTLEESINDGLSREEVVLMMDQVMVKYANYGAWDTEPRWVLEQILDEVFGKEVVSVRR
jgi:hypothetical protein